MASGVHTPLSFTFAEIFDRAFQIYRQHFLRLVAITLIVGVPMLLAQSLATQILLQGLSLGMIQLASFLAGLLVALIFGSLLNGALIGAVAQSLVSGEISVGLAYRAGLRRYLPLLLASLIPIGIERVISWVVGAVQTPVTALAFSGERFAFGSQALLFVAVVLLGLPLSLLLLCVYGQLFLYGQAVVLEDSGPLGGLERSWALLRGRRARGVLLVLLTRLLSYVFTSLPWLLLTFLYFRLADFRQGDARELFGAVSLVVGLLSLAVAAPLVNAIHTMAYFALRDQAEGRDLERSMPQVAP